MLTNPYPGLRPENLREYAMLFGVIARNLNRAPIIASPTNGRLINLNAYLWWYHTGRQIKQLADGA
jgi:hypothetical protein